jgi:two-component system C4-dicarboxylate transport response regulator DctD
MPDPAAPTELRLLIVDDDPLMTDMLPRRLLRALDLKILTASSPEEGLRVADEENPEVVLSDYNLRASMTGLDLLAEIERRHPDAVRILFSGHTRTEIGTPLVDAPLHAFLEKPIRIDELIGPLAAIIQRTLGIDPRRSAQ